MNLKQRIDLLVDLGKYCLSSDPAWETARNRAHADNGWFTPEFIDLAVRSIARQLLQRDKLEKWASGIPAGGSPAGGLAGGSPAGGYDGGHATPKTVGLIMAGNIPLVGFHDFLCIFISGHRQRIKPSGRDEALIRHLAGYLTATSEEAGSLIEFADRLNGCDAYIATGSNNSARYFDYYFGKYPHIIRRNRTSVAILNGEETTRELESLADDVYQYFGLGCRNVTKLYVPDNYDFVPLLEAFKKYDYLADYAKYKHNYDYQLTLLILNKKYYMTNGSVLLADNPSAFSPISVLNYDYYRPGGTDPALADNPEIQCVVGKGGIPFGKAQQPELTDYADGVDTLQFLRGL